MTIFYNVLKLRDSIVAKMPIVLSGAEWARLARWTQPEPPSAGARRAGYVRRLDELSREMSRAWPNSLENVNKRNEELRRARLAAAERANSNFYAEYVKKKHQEQLQLMQNARDAVFRNKDAPKLLRCAVIETAVQKERQEQLQFQAQRRQELEERKRQDDEHVIQKAKEWNELMSLREKRRFEANKSHQIEILKQAEEVRERNRCEYETELKMQKLDNELAAREMDALKDFEEDFKAKEKARIWADMERSRQETAALRREQAARDSMDDRLIEALQRARCRIDRRRKETELEERNEKLRVLEQISRKLESGDAVREAKEQAMLDKAVAERLAAEAERRATEERTRSRHRQQRRDLHQQQQRAAAARRHEADTARRWDLMNRFKNAELYEEFQQKLRKEKERKTKEYREYILQQWKERCDREAGEAAARREFYGPRAERGLRAADNQLLAHGGALLREAARLGRPTRPIRRALDHYCKLNRLYPMPELPRSQQEHFGGYAPRDLSAPDPGYVEPRLVPAPDAAPAPAPAPGPDDCLKRDGLVHAKGTNTKPAVIEEPLVGDYRRSGPANGMQRRPALQESSLPPITVVPCVMPSCACPLKNLQK